MQESPYIPETRLSEYEIRAGMKNGTLEPWRLDANGVQWYEQKELPVMHGVPVDVEMIVGDNEDDDV